MGIKLNIDSSVFDSDECSLITEVKGGTVGECLDYLVQKQPAIKKTIFNDRGNIFLESLVKVNGIPIFGALSEPVKDGDEIEILKFTGC